jgi:L-2-hydroxycarboxylate dehydrogenase (NAD+)
MNKNNVYIPVEQMQAFMVDVLAGVGVPRADAVVAAEVLISSDLRGIESHGIGRLKMYYDRIKAGTVSGVTNLEVVREGPTTAVIDGHYGLGHVIGVRAMQMAIDKARQYGMGSVAVRNSTHFGIDGYYPLMAVKAGMIGMSFTNARPSIAPTFGVKPMLGTNPIAFGAPTDEECPFLYDAATSITQRGKIEVAARAEKPVPEGWVVDRVGEAVTDPQSILKGFDQGSNALLPLGGAGELLAGYKGYGLATMVEILSASLQTGAFLYGLSGFDAQGNKIPLSVGHFFLAIDIAAFVDPEQFKATTGAILRELRCSDKEPGQQRIFTAGEKEFENEIRVRKEGIAINPALQKEMRAMQEGLGLSQYQFPF